MACLPKKLWWSLLHPAAVRITSLYLPSMVHDSPMPRSKNGSNFHPKPINLVYYFQYTLQFWLYTIKIWLLNDLILVIWIHIRWLILWSQRFNFLYWHSRIIYLVKKVIKSATLDGAVKSNGQLWIKVSLIFLECKLQILWSRPTCNFWK